MSVSRTSAHAHADARPRLRPRKVFSSCVVAGALAVSLAALPACASSGASSASNEQSQQTEQAQPGASATREDVEAVLLAASQKTFSNVAFELRTETSAVGPGQDGTMQSQMIKTSTIGELDQSGERPRLHMKYSAQSSMELGKVTYEMFISSENLIVNQNDQLYVDAMTDEALNSYVNSVVNVTAEEGIASMLDAAANYKIEETDGQTNVTITVDLDKAQQTAAEEADAVAETETATAETEAAASGEAESASAEAASVASAEATAASAGSASAEAASATSSDSADPASADDAMPAGTEMASIVVCYSIGEDGRFKSVRVVSSTTGTPTYHSKQTYKFTDYDTTTLPEWPDLKAYVAERSGVATDENGRMYVLGDNGERYYVSEIGDDGMIYFDTGTSSATDESYYYTYNDTPTDTGAVDTSSEDTTSSTGRAYITGDDGKIHYLDEEGSHLYENEDGTRYFVDADGNFYFLSE